MTIERAVIALAVVGLCRMSFFYFVSEPREVPRRAPIDARYARARALLPASGEIGYVSDLPPSTRAEEDGGSPGTELYLRAQYALAPLVLRPGAAVVATVVANVSDPGVLRDVLERNHLALIAEAGPGVAIARPR